MAKQNKLYVISLPIGQALDLSPRARSALEEADLIAAEDTRVFKTFATSLGITTKKVISYHDHNEKNSALGLIDLLKGGQSVALVSDAGTPGISDPSHHIVDLCFKEKITVTPIPGVSAVTAALSVCPIGGNAHTFLGFAPSKSNERKKLFEDLKKLEHRFVFFESPHRLIDHLTDALAVYGNISLFLAREMTKRYEEFLFEDIERLLENFKKKEPKGEFVMVYPPIEPVFDKKDFDQWLVEQIEEGSSNQDILKAAQSRTKMNRKSIYSQLIELKQRTKKV